MPKIKILPIAKSIAIALIFFALGRLLVMRWGNMGVFVALVLLVIFYAAWWAFNQRNK